MNKELHAKYEISQGAVIENANGEILILKLQNGGWVIPGGHLHSEEDWLDGLKREIYEETDIKNFDVANIIGVNTIGTCYGVCFHCRLGNNGNVSLSEEHEDFAWIKSKEDLEQYIFHKQILKHLVLKILNS